MLKVPFVADSMSYSILDIELLVSNVITPVSLQLSIKGYTLLTNFTYDQGDV